MVCRPRLPRLGRPSGAFRRRRRSPTSSLSKKRGTCAVLPTIGEIAAGQPIDAYEEQTEFLWVEASLARSSRNFVLKVRGHSMIGDGINDGDYVVVQPQSVAENGDTVVALVGNGVTLKRFYKEKGHIRLQPANPFLEPMIVSDVAIQGKVVAVIRRYE